MTTAEAETNLAVQHRAAQVNVVEQLEEALGEDYAGAWFDSEAGEFVVPVATGTDGRQASAAAKATVAEEFGSASLPSDFRAEVVNYSHEELEAGQEVLNEELEPFFAADQVQTAIEPEINAIIVRVPEDIDALALSQIEAVLGKASVAVDLVRLPAEAFKVGTSGCIESSRLCDLPVRGGEAMYGGPAWEENGQLLNEICTVGFRANGNDGEKYILTAGHCVKRDENPNGETNWEWFTTDTGGNRHYLGRTDQWHYPGKDWAKIDATGSWADTPPWPTELAYWGSTFEYPVVGEARPYVGETLCHIGMNTGASCGIVHAENVSVTYTAGYEAKMNSMFEVKGSGLALGGGDSGGPIIASNVALGMTSGGISAYNNATLYFNSITEADEELGVNVVGTGAPEAITGAPVSVGPYEATLSGQVDPHALGTSYVFEYGVGGLTNSTPVASAGASQGFVPVYSTIAGLQPLTTYRYRISATNSLRSVVGGEGTFTTPAAPPRVTEVGAEAGKLSATFHATVDGQGRATHYRFEYGTSAGALNQAVPVPDAQIGSGPTTVSQTATGIEGTIYYRVAATNEGGTTYSGINQIYVQERPTIAETAVSSHLGGAAEVRSSINPHGKETTYYLEYGPTGEYGSKTAAQGLGSGTGQEPRNLRIAGLEVGRDAHLRVVAENWAGVRYGPDVRFTPGMQSYGINKPAGGTGPNETRYTDDSCSAATHCMAVGWEGANGLGERGLAAEWNGARWVPEVLPAIAGMKEMDMKGVSCAPGASTCEVVGIEVGEGNAIVPIVFRRNAIGEWERQSFEAVVAEGEQHFSLPQGIECTSSSNCVAVGAAGFGPTLASKPLVERWNGSAWHAELLPLPAGVEHGGLVAVSCPAATSCAAVGYLGTGAGEPEGLFVEHWNGSSWSAEKVPGPSGALPEGIDRLADISCPTSAACELVTSYTDGSNVKRLYAEHWNGSTWASQSIPDPEGGPRFELPPPAIACPSATVCELAGGSNEAEGEKTSTTHPMQPYMMRWEGTSWSQQVLASAPRGKFQALACTEPTDCLAAGGEDEVSGEEVIRKGLAEAYVKTPTPTAETGAAKNVGETSATLTGIANSNFTGWVAESSEFDGSAKAYFEYGPTSAYGSSTPEQALLAGNDEREITAAITGLHEAGTYHYRLVVVGGGQTVHGQDRSLVTAESPRSTRSELAVLPVTDPFNGTTSAISKFGEGWTMLPWAASKGEDGSAGWRPGAYAGGATGASYGPTVTSLGSATAVEATMSQEPGLEGRWFAVWLDLPAHPTEKAGYQLTFLVNGPGHYKVSLVRWAAGSATTLAEAEIANYTFAPGASFALVDEGSTVSAWTNLGSGLTQLLSAADSTFSGGTAAVEGSGNVTRLTNLKFGLLQPKAPSVTSAISELRLDDALTKTEAHLSEGGTWEPLSWDYASSSYKTGTDTTQGWGPADAWESTHAIDGAYWTKATFADTGSGVGAGVTLASPPRLAERHFDLLLDMPSPSSAHSGYELRCTENPAESNYYSVTLYKNVAGTTTQLATRWGVEIPIGDMVVIVDKAGTLTAWRVRPATREFAELFSAADTTYTGGYAGIAGGGNETHLTNFTAGPLAPF